MSDGPLARIERVFGWRGFPHALFYKADYALRFELAGDVGTRPLRFMRAMERARIIADLAFEKSDTLTAVVSHYGGERRTRRESTCFRRLVEIGFPFSFAGPDRVLGDEGLYRYWYAADFHRSDEAMTALLWAAIGRELGVTPETRWISVHVVDFARTIAVHPYDDRGMDVIGPDRETVASLYDRLEEWLLAFDREAMDAKFR